MPTDNPPAPPGYVYRGRLFAPLRQVSWAKWWLIVSNFLALIPLAGGILFLWLPYQLYLVLGAPLAMGSGPHWSYPRLGFIGLICLLGSMVLHELLHGLMLYLTGHRPRFGFAGGFLYASTRPGQYLRRNDYLLMSLTPLVLMTLGGGLLLPWLPSTWGHILLICLLLNCAASTSDLMVVRLLLTWPPTTHFADFNGICVFEKLPPRSAQHSTKP